MTNDDAQLHERDWQFMLDSIYRINTTSSVEKLQYETLSCLRSLTPSYQGTFSMIKMEHGIARSSRPVIVGAPAHLIEKFTDNYDEDPYYDGLYLKTASYAFRDRDMIPEDVRESSPAWNEIYKPEGLTYALRALLSHDNAVIGEIALFNTKAESEFTNRDVRIANLMAPHIALKLASLLEEERWRTSTPCAQSIIEQAGLTLREREVIEHVLDGDSEQQIVEKLYISLSTVKKHVYNAYRKLNVNNRVQLKNLFDGK